MSKEQVKRSAFEDFLKQEIQSLLPSKLESLTEDELWNIYETLYAHKGIEAKKDMAKFLKLASR
jgi:hypothetical protein